MNQPISLDLFPEDPTGHPACPAADGHCPSELPSFNFDKLFTFDWPAFGDDIISKTILEFMRGSAFTEK